MVLLNESAVGGKNVSAVSNPNANFSVSIRNIFHENNFFMMNKGGDRNVS